MKTDDKLKDLDRFTEGVKQAAQSIHKLAELGEPFPNLEECIRAGQSPRWIVKTVSEAIADCEEVGQ